MKLIIDIDVTVSSAEHRIRWIEANNPNWAKFLDPALVSGDKPQPYSQKVIKKLLKQGHKIVWLTGRNEGLRQVTLKWLRKYFNSKTKNKDLWMRDLSNSQKPSKYKKSQLKQIFKKYGPIGLAFDDDPYTQKVYAKAGIIPVLAPDCWVFFYHFKKLEPERYWRH